MATVYIGLGSNVGDRIEAINQSITLLSQHPEIKLNKLSSFYETEPLEYPDQNWFVNAVAEVFTSLSPQDLLTYLINCEDKLQRDRTAKWGPRTIDLDILLYDNLIVSNSNLQIPHIRMHYRAFVLVPLSEIVPNLVHPIFNKTIKELLDELEDPTVVNKINLNSNDRYILF